MIVDELITLLGLRTDPNASKEAGAFSGLLGGVGTAAIAVGAALSAAASAIAGYAVQQAEAIDKEQELAATLGISYKRFQELAYAAKLSGGDVGTLSADLEGLQEKLRNPVTGEYNKSLQALGISAKNASGEFKGADEILVDLAGKFEGLTKAQQNQYAKLLRISPATVRLLQNGQKGLADMAAEANDLGLVLDQQAAVAANEFGDSMDRVKATTEGVGRAVAVGLLPGMTRVVDSFTGWLKANRALIASGIRQVVEGVGMGFQMVGEAVSVAWEFIKGLLPSVEGLTENLDATQAIAIAVALAIGAAGIAAAIAAAPFIAMAAAVAAVVLVVEDLYAAFTGGESIIGGWVESFTDAYPEISGVIGGIVGLVGTLAEMVGSVLVAAFDSLWQTIQSVFGGVFSLIQQALGGIESTIGAVKDLAGTSGVSAGVKAVVPVPAQVQAGASAAAAGGSTQVTNITVNGAGDPAAVGQAVVRQGGLGQSLQQSRPGATGPVTR